MTDRQLNFEKQSHIEAVAKLQKDIRKAQERSYYSSTAQAQQTIRHFALPMRDELVSWCEAVSKGRATTTASAAMAPELLNWFDVVSPEIIIVILLKSVLDIHGSDDPTTSKTANLIGGRIEDEFRFRFYELTAPQEVVDAAWKRVTEAGSSPHYRRISTKLITENLLEEKYPDAKRWKTWSMQYRHLMGLMLLDFSHHSGLIERFNKPSARNKTQGYVRLSPACLSFQERFGQELEDIAYFRKPLIDKPLPWEKSVGISAMNTTGGYHTENLRSQLPMCRGYNYRTEFSELSIRFLNTIGNTAYCVDYSVLKVAQQLAEMNHSIKSFNHSDRNPELEVGMPDEIAALPKDHPERIEWRKDRKKLHEHNRKQVQKSIRTRKSLAMAAEFLHHPRFYLSWSYDYRGRCYPQQPWLQPQTPEFEKALIRFADGCKLDKHSVKWCAQAIGAAYLGTRLNLEERAEWCWNNQPLIAAIASEPLDNIHLWENAKEPFQFLQLCMEWFKVVITKTQHLWYVPVGADATSSGLQLLSAMLRDEKGMRFSNVLPPLTADAPPEDAYILVLDKAKELATPEQQHLLPFMCHRDLGKTTMVMLYGATHYTIRDRVIDVFMGTGDYKAKRVSWKDCDAIATLLEQASAEVFPAAFGALKWLAVLAGKAVKASPDEFEWTTPAGDIIRLREFKTEVLKIRTTHLGKTTIPVAKSKERDYKSMKSALPPSFVHSYDAALLKIAFDGWTQPVSVIHDCIKTLPADLDAALDRIRKSFYTCCDGNPLDKLATELKVEDKKHKRMEMGNGKLDDVLDSTYLFN